MQILLGGYIVGSPRLITPAALLREILLVMIYSQIILRHVLNNCFTANQITVLNRKGFLCKLKMVRRDEQVPITHWLSMINSILNTCIEIISFMICSIHLLMTTAYFYTIWMIFMCRKYLCLFHMWNTPTKLAKHYLSQDIL